jgi:hypothetical protein
MVCANRTIGSEIILDTADGTHFILVCLETVLVLVQDRCMVCAKRTIISEMVLDTPDGTPGDEAQVKARFGPFVDSANLNTG